MAETRGVLGSKWIGDIGNRYSLDGVASTAIPDGADLNGYLDTGNYAVNGTDACNTILNRPAGLANSFNMQVIRYANTNMVEQRISCAYTNRQWSRRYYSQEEPSWSEWLPLGVARDDAGKLELAEFSKVRSLLSGRPIASGTDLDDVTEPGNYACNVAYSTLNCPTSLTFDMLVSDVYGANRVRQEITDTSSNVWSRHMIDGTWNPWKKVVETVGGEPLGIDAGGTGASDADEARANLNAAKKPEKVGDYWTVHGLGANGEIDRPIVGDIRDPNMDALGNIDGKSAIPTALAVSEAINGIKGGRNYLLGTADGNRLRGTSKAQSSISPVDATVNGVPCKKFDFPGLSGENTWAYVYHPIGADAYGMLVPGEDYTVSFTTDYAGALNVAIMRGDGTERASSTGSGKVQNGLFSANVKMNGEIPPFHAQVVYINNGGGFSNESVSVGHVKLERGAQATDWCPAPEDMARKADLEGFLNSNSPVAIPKNANLNDYHQTGVYASPDLSVTKTLINAPETVWSSFLMYVYQPWGPEYFTVQVIEDLAGVRHYRWYNNLDNEKSEWKRDWSVASSKEYARIAMDVAKAPDIAGTWPDLYETVTACNESGVVHDKVVTGDLGVETYGGNTTIPNTASVNAALAKKQDKAVYTFRWGNTDSLLNDSEFVTQVFTVIEAGGDGIVGQLSVHGRAQSGEYLSVQDGVLRLDFDRMFDDNAIEADVFTGVASELCKNWNTVPNINVKSCPVHLAVTYTKTDGTLSEPCVSGRLEYGNQVDVDVTSFANMEQGLINAYFQYTTTVYVTKVMPV